MNKEKLLQAIEKEKNEYIKKESGDSEKIKNKNKEIIREATKIERFLYKFHFSEFSSLFYSLYLFICFLIVVFVDKNGVPDYLTTILIVFMFTILFGTELMNERFVNKHNLQNDFFNNNIENDYLNIKVSKNILELFSKEFDKEFFCYVLTKYNLNIKNSDLIYEIKLLQEGINNVELARKIYDSFNNGEKNERSI